MADNTVLSSAVGLGDTIASDDIGGIKFQRVKFIHGIDGVNDGDVALTNGLPVQQATGVSFAVTGTFFQATQPVSLASVPTHAVTQSGTWTIQPGNTPNNTPWLASIHDGTTKANVIDLTTRDALAVALVDTNGDQISSFGGGTQYTEDAAAAANPVGTALNLVRDDARVGSLTSANGDNVAARGTDAGELYVKHVDAIPSSQSGTWNITNVSGTISLPTGAATSAKQPALGTAGSASTDVITVQGIASGTALPVSQNGTWNVGTVTTVTGVTTVSTVTTVSAITGGGTTHDAAASSINPLLLGAYASAAAPSDVSADNDAVRLWALRSGALCNQPTFAGILAVAGNGASGTGVQRVTIANDSTGVLAGVTTVTTLTGGGVAHDGVDSGNPIKIGARAAATLSDDTMVANADRVDNVADLDGALIVRNGRPLGDLISERVTNTDGVSTAFTNFAAVANTRNYVTKIAVYNSSASAGTIDFRDGTSGAVLWTMPLPAGGGSIIGGDEPIFRTSANTALAYDVSAALSTVTISVSGFASKV